MSDTVNLTERHEKGQWAVYLPALSGFYTDTLGKIQNKPDYYMPEGRLPKGFEHGAQGIDFLRKDDSYFYYKWCLYSAGHADRNLQKCDKSEPMVHGRDKQNTVLVGDSGGFQVATGVIKMDWKTIRGPEGDPLRKEIMEFLEYSFDWSMTLDIPAFAATAPLNKKTGLTKFEDTLDITEINLKYFLKNRTPGKTKFLNVLSGSTAQNSKIWFDRVIPYSNPTVVEALGYTPDRTLEGYAFAGINMRHMPTLLNRILDLREMDALKGKDWIHFLGIGRLDWSCYLTSIMRELRKYDNPNVVCSFDAASPFVAVAYGLSYNYNTFSSKRLTYSMDKAVDEKSLKNSDLAMPFQSPIMDRLTAGDICYLGEGDLNKNGKESKTSWDVFTYALYMSHNVYNHIQAVQEINRLADIEYKRKKVNYTDWTKERKTSTANELSPFVSSSILIFNDFVQKVLDPANPNPRKMIDDFSVFLETISFGASGSTSKLHDLFETDEVSEDDMASFNDPKLTALEDELKNE
jgi:hypothetical protein